jgi:hypothetical protein
MTNNSETNSAQTSDQLFYVVSVRHTKRTDRYITFWRPDSRGYAWPLSWAGKYPIEEISFEYHNSGDISVTIPCEVADRIAVQPEKGRIDNDAGPVVKNNATNWKTILAAVIEPPSHKPDPQYRGKKKAA